MVSSIGSSSGSQTALLQMMQNRLQDMFSKTDTDGDGSLTLEEFKSGAAQGGKAPPTGAPSLEDLFASADADGNGSLTQDEFASAFKPPAGGAQAPMLSSGTSDALLKMFQETDRDGDGSLTLDEFKAGAKNGNTDGLDELFASADANGDNVLSADEFTTALESKGPPPGGPPPGGPPPSAQTDDEDAISALLEMLSSASGTSSDETSALDQLFTYLDEDSDGSVSKDEMTSGLESLKSQMMSSLLDAQETAKAA